MSNAVSCLVLVGATALVGALFSACGGRVDDVVETASDAGADAPVADAAPTATTPRPSRCPDSVPIRGLPCFRGDVCDYCEAGAAEGVRATCPSGSWVLEERACPVPSDPGDEPSDD